LSLCSALRASDLLALTVADVQGRDGAILSESGTRQRKTRRPVRFNISDPARAALRAHVDAHALAPDAPLFTAERRRNPRPLTVETFRQLTKRWADSAGHRDTSRYAAHSTRRSLAVSMYQRTRDIAAVSRVLGHSSLRHTAAYLGVDDDAALALARECEL
jgi:integrase